MSATKLGEPGARLQCPRNGRFYVCDKKPVRFLGCCNIDPCATKDGNCPHNSLEPTGFERDAFPWLTMQNCVDDEDDKTQWYTCTTPMPQFMGCCTVNPCTMQGCPFDKLRAARLSGRKENAEVFVQQPFHNTYPFSPESLGPVPSVADRTLSPDSHMCASATASGQVTPLPANHDHPHFIPCEPVELPATEPANLASLSRKETEEKAPKVDEGVEMEPAELADTSKPCGKESNPDKMKEQ